MSAAAATNRIRLVLWLTEDLVSAGITSEQAKHLPIERWEAIAVSLPTPPDAEIRQQAIVSLEERERFARDPFKAFEGE